MIKRCLDATLLQDRGALQQACSQITRLVDAVTSTGYIAYRFQGTFVSLAGWVSEARPFPMHHAGERTRLLYLSATSAHAARTSGMVAESNATSW